MYYNRRMRNTFEMTNGSTLTVEWEESVLPGGRDHEEEVDTPEPSDALILIDSTRTSYYDLPYGLDEVVDRMVQDDLRENAVEY